MSKEATQLEPTIHQYEPKIVKEHPIPTSQSIPEISQRMVPPLNLHQKIGDMVERSKSDPKSLSSNRELLQSNRDVAINILLKNSSKKVQIEIIPKMNEYAYVKKKRYFNQVEKKTRQD